MMTPDEEPADNPDEQETHDDLNGDAGEEHASQQSPGDGPEDSSQPDKDGASEFMDNLSAKYRNAWDFGDDEVVSVVRGWMGSEARKTLEKMGRSYDTIRAEAKWQFHQHIRRPYRQGFELLPTRGESQAALGRRYGMNRATVKRWLDGNNEPSFDAFCIVSVADDCRYPRGHRIALNAYAAVLQRTQSLLGKTDVVPVSVEDVACLYLQSQHKQWWLAWFDDDERLHAEAAKHIRDILHNQFGSTQPWDMEQQRKLYRQLWLEWAITQEAIPYEWF
ncbi:MAG: helix-turn-helix domain-containing protein [Planctomycetaceae bacterium]